VADLREWVRAEWKRLDKAAKSSSVPVLTDAEIQRWHLMYMSDADFGSNGLDALVSLLSDARAMGFAEAAKVARDISEEAAGFREEFARGASAVASSIDARAAKVRR
jgi:hypothetical protein